MALHHATRIVDQPARMHLSSGGAFVVVSCPDDDFAPGASFGFADIEAGLKKQTWPEGMVFRRRGDDMIYTVRGNMLFAKSGRLIF